MKSHVLRVIRWALVVLMVALALFICSGTAFYVFANLNPIAPGSHLALILGIAMVAAAALAVRYSWLPLLMGVLHWIVDISVFQLGEQHATWIHAIQHSSLDLAFIFLAVVFWIISRRGRLKVDRAGGPGPSQQGTENNGTIGRTQL